MAQPRASAAPAASVEKTAEALEELQLSTSRTPPSPSSTAATTVAAAAGIEEQQGEESWEDLAESLGADSNPEHPDGLNRREVAADEGDEVEEEDEEDWESEWQNDISKLKSAQQVQSAGKRNTPSTQKSLPSSATKSRATAAVAGEDQDDWESSATLSASKSHTSTASRCQYEEQVLEVFGFGSRLDDGELQNFIAEEQVAYQGVKVVRLDETHALAVFSSIHAAEEILLADSKQFQTRSLKQASATAKKVRWESLDTPVPPRQRPKSTAMVARRLIGAALGDSSIRKQLRRPEDAKDIRKMREEKQAQMKAKQKALEEAWGDD